MHAKFTLAEGGAQKMICLGHCEKLSFLINQQVHVFLFGFFRDKIPEAFYERDITTQTTTLL